MDYRSKERQRPTYERVPEKSGLESALEGGAEGHASGKKAGCNLTIFVKVPARLPYVACFFASLVGPNS
jgi:hypothetical protein